MGSDSRTATATSSTPRPSWRDRHLSQLSDEQLDDVKKHRAGTGSKDETTAEAVARQVADKDSDRASASAAQVAGIETEIGQTAKVDTKTPKPQAGPDREKRREKVGDRASSEARDQTRDKACEQTREARGNLERQSHSRRSQERRPSRERERNEFRAPFRQPQPGERGYNRRDSRRRDYDDREVSRYNQRAEKSSAAINRDRDDYRERNDYRDIDRDGTRRGRCAPASWQDERRGNSHRRGNREAESKRPNRQYTAASNTKAHEQPLRGEDTAKKSIVNRLLDFKLQGPVKYGLMALAVVAMIALSLMKPIDNSSQSQLDSALTRAMIGFGLARTLNGVISVAQGTEFAVQPAGVGVNFSPGEILDPINDLVERFSWVMLLATSSLGVQKILLEVSSWAGISVLLGGAGLFFLLTRMRNSSMARMADIAGKLLLVMLLIRFLIPVGALANDWVYKQFLQPKYEESSAQLEIASTRIREISARQTQSEKNDGSIKERFKGLYNSMTSKFDFDGMLNDYKDSAENVSEHAISLIVVFMLQTVVFPLLFLYLIYRLFRSILLPSKSST